MSATRDQRAPFRYVLEWQKEGVERIAVEARYRNFLKGRGHEELIDLGWVDGPRCSMLWDLVENVEKRYQHSGDGSHMTIDLPDGPGGEDLGRRIALMATVLREAPPTASMERAYDYLESAPGFEINFWMSKLMDQEVGAGSVVPALLLMSGSMRVRPAQR